MVLGLTKGEVRIPEKGWFFAYGYRIFYLIVYIRAHWLDRAPSKFQFAAWEKENRWWVRQPSLRPPRSPGYNSFSNESAKPCQRTDRDRTQHLFRDIWRGQVVSPGSYGRDGNSLSIVGYRLDIATFRLVWFAH